MADFLPDPENEATTPSSSDTHNSLIARKRIKHLLIGDPALVRSTIQNLHVLGYAEVREWSKPVSAANSLGEPGEVVSILIRQVISDT